MNTQLFYVETDHLQRVASRSVSRSVRFDEGFMLTQTTYLLLLWVTAMTFSKHLIHDIRSSVKH